MRIVNDNEVRWDELEDLAAELLEYPADSFWSDSELWETHTLLFGTPAPDQTDDYLADYANYRYALEQLQAHYSEEEVSEATFGHWTYSQFVAIKVKVREANGELSPAFIEAITLWQLSQELGILDDATYSEELSRVEGEQLDYLVEEYKVDRHELWEVLSNHGGYVPGYGWEADIEYAMKQARFASQTWEAHYYSGQYHEPEFCGYCERAVEVSA